MLEAGKILESVSHRRFRVKGFIRAGGQGEAYWVTVCGTGEKGVVKVFHKQFANAETVKRLRFLTAKRLNKECPSLCTPTDLLSSNGRVGHYARLAPGKSLEDFLQNGNGGFLECLQLAAVLAHAVAVLHRHQIAHGDLQAENVMVNRRSRMLELYVIDFDNFRAPGLPGPPCVGHNLYMAPELRLALAQGRQAVLDERSDQYALGVLIHELVLSKHVTAGSDQDEAQFQKAMCSGCWLHDPATADKPSPGVGGYASEVLNADLARLFRRSLSANRELRPKAKEWEDNLVKALNEVFVCPKCGGPFLIDSSKTVCPLCGHRIPGLSVVRADGRVLVLDRGALVVGRNELSGSLKVSVRHAVFRRVGPETWLESLGRNGTYRWAGSGWVKLPDGKPVLVQRGDRLRLGDIEVELQ